MTGVKDLLDALPVFSEAWLKTEFVDPKTGLIIAKLTQDSALVPARFHSTLMIQTNQGPATIAFQIEATTLDEAVKGWNAAARKAISDFDAQMRANASRIVLPSPAMRPGIPNHG